MKGKPRVASHYLLADPRGRCARIRDHGRDRQRTAALKGRERVMRIIGWVINWNIWWRRYDADYDRAVTETLKGECI